MEGMALENIIEKRKLIIKDYNRPYRAYTCIYMMVKVACRTLRIDHIRRIYKESIFIWHVFLGMITLGFRIVMR
jgi:hypothetical protein